MQCAEPDLALAELLDELDQVFEGAAESVQAAGYQRVAGAQPVERAVSPGELVSSPGWVLTRLVNASRTFIGAPLDSVTERDIAALKLGKKATATYKTAIEVHEALNRNVYTGPPVRFTDAEIDQARAAGVLVEADGRAAIVTDRALYRELCRQAIARTLRDLEAAKQQRAADRAQSRAATPQTPAQEAEVEHRAQLRELTRQAHGVNLDLGAALMQSLGVVDPNDINVARFFAYGLLGPSTGAYLGTADHTARVIAESGIRLVLDQFRTTETPTLRSGRPGRTKVTYGDVDDALGWLWKFVAGAKTAGELYGRVMVVFAAQRYAEQLVLPRSRHRASVLPDSYDDKATRAFERVAAKVLPATYRALRRAIEQAAADHKKTNANTRKTAGRPMPAAQPSPVDDVDEQQVDDDELAEDPILEDLDEAA